MAKENEGGIRRGDRADTGDLEARPTEGVGPGGSGVPGGYGGYGGSTGHVTAATDSLDAPVDTGEAEIHGDTGLEDLTVHGATDPDLGLTNVGDVPADDWAADTGPTRTGESSAQGVGRRLMDADGTLIPDTDAEGRIRKPKTRTR